MADFLGESGLRANRPRVLQALMPGTTAKYEQDMKKMKDLASKSTSLFLVYILLNSLSCFYSQSTSGAQEGLAGYHVEFS
jgi:hypothetical protein